MAWPPLGPGSENAGRRVGKPASSPISTTQHCCVFGSIRQSQVFLVFREEDLFLFHRVVIYCDPPCTGLCGGLVPAAHCCALREEAVISKTNRSAAVARRRLLTLPRTLLPGSPGLLPRTSSISHKQPRPQYQSSVVVQSKTVGKSRTNPSIKRVAFYDIKNKIKIKNIRTQQTKNDMLYCVLANFLVA